MLHAVERLQQSPADTEAMRGGTTPWLISAKFKLVDGCNLRCFMCDYWKRNREQELSTSEVTAVLDDLAALRCRKVHFSGGEVLLRRDFLEICEHATNVGLRVNLTTNGTMLTKATVRALTDIPVRSVTVSVDSPVDYVHDSIRGQENAYKRTVKGLDRLLSKRGKKTRVRINTVVSRRNYLTLLAMPEFLRERAVDGWLLIPVDSGGDSSDAMRVEDIQRYNAEVAPMLELLVKVPGFDPWVYGRSGEDHRACSKREYARGYYDENRCWAPWFHTLIDARGDVYPCCSGHRRVRSLGSVRESSLREIIAGAAYQELRRTMWNERLSICAQCDDFLSDNAAVSDVLGA